MRNKLSLYQVKPTKNTTTLYQYLSLFKRTPPPPHQLTCYLVDNLGLINVLTVCVPLTATYTLLIVKIH